MHRFHNATAAVVSALVIAALAGGNVAAQVPRHDGRSLHIDGDAAALHVDVHQTTMADVLSALGGLNVRYRSSIGLDEVLDGSYAGSLRHIVARLLDEYNYMTTQHGSNLEVVIFGRRGEMAVPAPILIAVRQRPSD